MLTKILKKLRFLGDDDQPIADINVENVSMAVQASTTSNLLPASTDMYREATKSIVILASSIVTLGFTFFKDSIPGQRELYVFMFSGGILFLSVIAGLLCHGYLIEWASLYENPERGNRVDQVSSLQNYVRWSYRIMVWAFLFGILFFAVFATMYIDGKASSATSQKQKPDFLFIPQQSSDPSVAGLLLDRKTKQVWEVLQEQRNQTRGKSDNTNNKSQR